MTFETFLSLRLAIPVSEAQRWLDLTNGLREVLGREQNLEALREHYARKQKMLAARQRGCAVGDALFPYLQGAAVQAGLEPEEWAREFESLNALREQWAMENLPSTDNQEEQT